MDKNSVLTTQYKVYNDCRLHFGRLFWQNIALHIVGVMAIFLFWKLLPGDISRILMYGVGPASILIAFIAWRLRKLEAIYENHLRDIEDVWIAQGIAGIQRAPISEKLGARILVVIILAGGGIIVTVLSVIFN